VVLRHRDLGEADRIVRLFTPERGKIAAVAKGVRRPKSKLAAAVQPFTHSRFQIAVGRSLDVVTQAQVIDPHYALREGLSQFAYANHLSELIDGFLEERQRSPRAFELYLSALKRLAAGEAADIVALTFELRLLPVLGFGLPWDVDPGATALSREATQLAQALASHRRSEIPSASAGARRELERAMHRLLEFHLDRPLRSARFIAELAGPRGN
jgi:hypothetical protein